MAEETTKKPLEILIIHDGTGDGHSGRKEKAGIYEMMYKAAAARQGVDVKTSVLDFSQAGDEEVKAAMRGKTLVITELDGLGGDLPGSDVQRFKQIVKETQAEGIRPEVHMCSGAYTDNTIEYGIRQRSAAGYIPNIPEILTQLAAKQKQPETPGTQVTGAAANPVVATDKGLAKFMMGL